MNYFSLNLFLLIFIIIDLRAESIPKNFVYLSEFAPEITQDIRYFGEYNFIGRPIVGYQAAECILTFPAASALKLIQADLAPAGLCLKIFDCYRPTQAVAHFIRWSQNPFDQVMKLAFYPNINKADFFKLGYVAERSGHSRGSTVDVILEPCHHKLNQPTELIKYQLSSCTASYESRFPESALDFGTGFDCMDPLSHPANTAVTASAQANRAQLAAAFDRRGFRPLVEEWWHFTLRNEPFPETYFDFPVTAAPHIKNK